jgi:hypothetical protein
VYHYPRGYKTLDTAPFVNIVTCQVIPEYDGMQKVVEDVYEGERAAVKAFLPDVMTNMYGEINDELFDRWLNGRDCDENGIVYFHCVSRTFITNVAGLNIYYGLYKNLEVDLCDYG